MVLLVDRKHYLGISIGIRIGISITNSIKKIKNGKLVEKVENFLT